MEEFVFNDCNVCTNPNKVNGEMKRFRWEITTAFNGKSWVHGYDFSTPTSGWGCGAWKKDTENFTTEHEAIEAGAKKGLYFFEQAKKEGMNIPAQLFQDLKSLCGKPQPVQLTLFGFC